MRGPISWVYWFPYLSQVGGEDLQVSLLPSISDIGANRFASRTGARANAYNYVVGSPRGRSAASCNANPGVVAIAGAMAQPDRRSSVGGPSRR